jgi:hypothetical protein
MTTAREIADSNPELKANISYVDQQFYKKITSINQQSGTSYTAVLLDQDKLVELSNTNAITFTVPPNASVAFPIGASINILQTNIGQVTVVGGSGVTVNSANGLKLRTQWSGASLTKRSENVWIMIGDSS